MNHHNPLSSPTHWVFYQCMFLLHIVTQQGHGLHIRPKPCYNGKGEQGTCMFVWDCINTNGQHLGSCSDAYLIGSCCAHDDELNKVSHESGGKKRKPPHATTAISVAVVPHKTHTSYEVQRPAVVVTSPTLHVENSNLSRDPPSTVLGISSTNGNISSFLQTTLSPDSTTLYSVNYTSRISTALSTNSMISTENPTFSSGAANKRPLVENSSSKQSLSTTVISILNPNDTTRKPGFTTSMWAGPVRKPTGFPEKSTTTTGTIERSTITATTVQSPTTLTPTVFTPTNTTSTVATSTTVTTTSIPEITASTKLCTSSSKTKVPPSTVSISTTIATTVTSERTTSNEKFTSSTTTRNMTTIKPVSTSMFFPGHINSHTTTWDFPKRKPIDPYKECGIPPLHARTKIVGGQNAAFGAWPWQVSVRRTSFFGFSSNHRCGGAILNSKWIATAGHCVDDLLLSQIRVRMGEHDFSSVMEPYSFVERGVRRKVVHPSYNFFTYENDLALVELEAPVKYRPHIAPICLPSNEDFLIGRNASITGWGRLKEGGVLPSILQEVQVPIISNHKCKIMFLAAGRREYIPDIFMCSGLEEGRKDSCQGDSGGPVQVQGEDGRWFLAGIISWGIGCGEPNLPGVCTRISKYKTWILKNIK